MLFSPTTLRLRLLMLVVVAASAALGDRLASLTDRGHAIRAAAAAPQSHCEATHASSLDFCCEP